MQRASSDKMRAVHCGAIMDTRDWTAPLNRCLSRHALSNAPKVRGARGFEGQKPQSIRHLKDACFSNDRKHTRINITVAYCLVSCFVEIAFLIAAAEFWQGHPCMRGHYGEDNMERTPKNLPLTLFALIDNFCLHRSSETLVNT